MTRLPSSTASPSLLLFVAGEPETTPGIRESGVGVLPRWAGMFGASGVLPKHLRPAYAASHGIRDEFEQPPLTDRRPWHLPPQQVACIDVVLDAAERERRTVLVIDVNRPEDHQELVDRWVMPNDVMPLLVRPDGRRLDGEENFVPHRVRQFITGR